MILSPWATEVIEEIRLLRANVARLYKEKRATDAEILDLQHRLDEMTEIARFGLGLAEILGPPDPGTHVIRYHRAQLEALNPKKDQS